MIPRCWLIWSRPLPSSPPNALKSVAPRSLLLVPQQGPSKSSTLVPLLPGMRPLGCWRPIYHHHGAYSPVTPTQGQNWLIAVRTSNKTRLPSVHADARQTANKTGSVSCCLVVGYWNRGVSGEGHGAARQGVVTSSRGRYRPMSTPYSTSQIFTGRRPFVSASQRNQRRVVSISRTWPGRRKADDGRMKCSRADFRLRLERLPDVEPSLARGLHEQSAISCKLK